MNNTPEYQLKVDTAVIAADYVAFNAFTWFRYPSNRPMVLMVMFLEFIVIPFNIISTVMYGELSSEWLFVMINVVFWFVFLFIFVFSLTLQPKRHFKKIHGPNDQDTYLFDDQSFTNTSVSKKGHTQQRLDYSTLTSAFETEDYFYLFLNKSLAFIVPKRGFIEGTPEDLRTILKAAMNRKFKITK